MSPAQTLGNHQEEPSDRIQITLRSMRAVSQQKFSNLNQKKGVRALLSSVCLRSIFVSQFRGLFIISSPLSVVVYSHFLELNPHDVFVIGLPPYLSVVLATY